MRHKTLHNIDVFFMGQPWANAIDLFHEQAARFAFNRVNPVLQLARPVRTSMMNIILYRKAGCPWAREVMDYLNEHKLPFEDREITKNPAFAEEVEEKTGQSKSPTLDIDGKYLPDAGVEEVAQYLETLGVKA